MNIILNPGCESPAAGTLGTVPFHSQDNQTMPSSN